MQKGVNLQENKKHSDMELGADLFKQLYSDLYPVRVVVQQQNTRAGHLLSFHHRFQIGQ